MPAEYQANSCPVLRVAVAHLFATGPYQEGGPHGLVHVGLLPLVAGAQVQEWVINPEKKFSGALGNRMGIDNPTAKAVATWAEQQVVIQEAFAGFDAVLVMDRAGEPSPEREWLEKVVLPKRSGRAHPVVCVSLDELLAFFRPGEVLDDVEELLDKLLLTDKEAEKRLGWGKSKPQLPFQLVAMRKAVRLVLEVVLRRGPEGGVSFPMLALLRQALRLAPAKPSALRSFRLIEKLATQQPDCCEEITAVGQPTKQRLPQPPAVLPAGVEALELVAAWFDHWGQRDDGTAEPEIGLGDDLTAAQIDDAFDKLRKQAAADGHVLVARAPQEKYARFVAEALNEGGAYALEAGTGTGKTYGYLVPLLEYLFRNPKAAVVVATSTKNLQDQMQTGELPALLTRGRDGKRTGRYKAVKTAILKGKNCYLCAVALADQYEACFDDRAAWQAALAWLYLGLRLRDTAGEIESVARSIERLLGADLAGLRPAVAADKACRHEPQPGLKLCVFGTHRQRAENANLVITNHYKLLSLPQPLLERATACIVDEADRFPDNLRGALSRSFSARDVMQETLLPLLGYDHDLAPSPWKGKRRAPTPLLKTLTTRLNEISSHLYYHLPAVDRPRSGPEELAYELLAEAEVAELTGQAFLREEVATALLDTPLATDARTTADAAWLAMQAASAVVRQRRAVRALREALTEVETPLVATGKALSEMGQQFQATGQQRAALPFGLGPVHWQDEQDAAQPGQRYTPHCFLKELKGALALVQAPCAEAGRLLAILAANWPTACALAAAALESRRAGDEVADASQLAEKESMADERLTKRITLLIGQFQQQLAVLERLLKETPTADFIPVLDRLWPEADPLGWSLTRQPANLWPYLVTADPAAPGQALQPQPDETSEAFADRRQAARQRQAARIGDPVLPLYEQFRTVLFTSATLYVQGALDYLRHLLDQPVPFAKAERIEAVFDYGGREKVVASQPTWLPRFTSQFLRSPAALLAWREAQCRLLLPLLLAFEGRTLVLFTSNADLEFVREWLGPQLAAHDIELISQPARGSSQ